MASHTVTSVPSTASRQPRPTWRKRLLNTVDRLIDQHVKAAHHAAEQDRQHKGQAIRPSLMFLTE